MPLSRTGCFERTGPFIVSQKETAKSWKKNFRTKVLALLKGEGRTLYDELLEKPMDGIDSGFGMNAGNRIAPTDRDGQKALAEYTLRSGLSEQRITYVEGSGKVLYRSGMAHGATRKNFEVFSAEEFIAAITEHIPDKHSRIGVRDKLQMVGTMAGIRAEAGGERTKDEPLWPGDEPFRSEETPEITVLDVSDPTPAHTFNDLGESWSKKDLRGGSALLSVSSLTLNGHRRKTTMPTVPIPGKSSTLKQLCIVVELTAVSLKCEAVVHPEEQELV